MDAPTLKNYPRHTEQGERLAECVAIEEHRKALIDIAERRHKLANEAAKSGMRST